MDRDERHRQFFSCLVDDFPETYANPQNAIIVPYRTTRVMIDSEALGDGRFSVTLRAAILMDLGLTAELVAHVAMQANAFRFGNLYLYQAVDDAYDLDFTLKLMDTWLTASDLVEMVHVAGESAIGKAEALQGRFGGRLPNPTGTVKHRTFIASGSSDRQDVWEALNAALETQRCLVLGTAETVELSQIGSIVEGWFLVNVDHLWFAGRHRQTRQTVLWRIPHADVLHDHTLENERSGAYRAQLRDGNVLTATTMSVAAAAAILDAHRDPRDPNVAA